MGESKRRRKLDPNYGQPSILGLGAHFTQDFFDRKVDIAILKAEHLLPEVFAGIDRKFGTCHHFLAPMEPKNNLARQFFVDNKERIMDATKPIAQEHGKGWIFQLYNDGTDTTDFSYTPANSISLRCLACDVFTRSLGNEVRAIMRDALTRWDWSNCVPMISMSTEDKTPAWIYIA